MIAQVKGYLLIGAIGLLGIDPIPVSGDEATWMFRGVMGLFVMGTWAYLKSLHKKVEECANIPDAVDLQWQHMRAIVRVLAVEAEMHGEKRSSDHLILALREELEQDIKEYNRRNK